jgi:hypothetical protein
MPAAQNVNRVANLIRQYEASIAERLANGKTTQQQVDKLNRILSMDVGDYCRFQALKSFAFAAGKMTLEEAQTIYAYLGNSVGTFNAQSVAIKAVLTQVFQELLEMRIREKRKAE